MAALDHRDVVGDAVGVRLVEGERLGARVDREGAGDRDVHVIRDVAVHLHADVFRTKQRCVRANHARPVDRQAQVVDHGVAHDPGLADRQRL